MLNFFLIPRYAYVGVAVSVVCAETVITLAHYIFAMKYMKLNFMILSLLNPLFQLW